MIQLGGQLIFYKRAFDRDCGQHFRIVCRAHLGPKTELTVGAPVSDQDSTARHIATEQQALRSAKNLDALDVKRIENHTEVCSQENAIDENADRRINRWNRAVDALTANREALYARERANLPHLHVRHQVAKIIDFLQEQRFDLRGAERRDRDV